MSSVAAITKLHDLGLGVFFRARDAEAAGLSFRDLERFVTAGEIEKFTPGLYRIAAAEASELETIAMICAAVPQGIVCLLSALRIHEIGKKAPHEVWLALDRKARKPTRLPARVHFARFSGPMLTYGVEKRDVDGVNVRLTSPARTVVDCFRYRNKIGLDVAIEALRDAVRSRKATVSEIARTADVCRASTVMQPFLASLVS